jgi:predicted small metal-binding protein
MNTIDPNQNPLEQLTKEELIKYDRTQLQELLKEISKEYINRKSSNWSKIRGYDTLDKLKSKKQYIKQLRECYYDCNPDKTEELLKLMPEHYKNSKKYTLLVDELFHSLKNNIYHRTAWQPIKADTMQNLLIHHPNKKITITGLECLIANNIGSGTNKDIHYQICNKIDECRWIITEPDICYEDAKGYWKYSDNCLIHSNKIYKNKEDRLKLWDKWDEIIKEYLQNKLI